MSRDHQLVSLVIQDFEAVAALVERTIKTLAAGDSECLDLDALHRAKHAALYGAEQARKVLPSDD